MRTANPDAPAKKKIIAAAKELMLTKGYNDTSVDEICKKSGVAKGSFFHYFKDKEAVASEAVNCFIHDTGSRMLGCCEGEGDPLRRIYRMIDNTIETTQCPEFKGCLMGTLLQETFRTHPKLRDACGAGVEGAYTFLEKTFKAAKAKHAPKSAVDPRKMAEFYLSVVQGSFLLAKAQGSPKVIESNLKTLKQQIQQVFEG